MKQWAESSDDAAKRRMLHFLPFSPDFEHRSPKHEQLRQRGLVSGSSSTNCSAVLAMALTRCPAGPPRRPESCGDACIVAVGPPAAYDKLLGSMCELLNVAARRLALSLTAERRRTRVRAHRRSAARDGVRNARLSARREGKVCEGFGPGALGGVMGGSPQVRRWRRRAAARARAAARPRRARTRGRSWGGREDVLRGPATRAWGACM